jgi:excisionase family DNA binding protein
MTIGFIAPGGALVAPQPERPAPDRQRGYSVEEAARAIGVGVKTMYGLTNQPGFPVVRIGNRKVIPVDGLDKWLQERTGAAKRVLRARRKNGPAIHRLEDNRTEPPQQDAALRVAASDSVAGLPEKPNRSTST